MECQGAAVAALEPPHLKALCVAGGLCRPHLRQSPPDPDHKLRNKAARAPVKGGYGSLLIGRPSNDAFLFPDSLAKYQPPPFASRSQMHDVILFLASAMCCDNEMLVMDYLVFFSLALRLSEVHALGVCTEKGEEHSM
jgi:hypothetical protein